MFVADANLLIYAAIRESPYHLRAQRLVQRWGDSAEAWSVSWSIVYEFLSVSTRRGLG